ncbi:MAG: VOC family protein [Candidatus Eremiobacteraeota bacterium]|nr:VOC family protein [Candidatus Eremiobacteraeota bacterium]
MSVSDLPRAIAFYRDVFGFQLSGETFNVEPCRVTPAGAWEHFLVSRRRYFPKVVR